MRITIETESRETLSVTQSGPGQSAETLEAIDGGAPPQELVELLSGVSAEEDPEVAATGRYEPDNAGSAPAWLVDVIEGASSVGTDDSIES